VVERDDELEELRSLWRDVRPPAVSDSLDEETERAVEWMRAAWNAVEAPPLPAALERSVPRETTTGWTGAALFLIAASVFVVFALRSPIVEGPGSRPVDDTATNALEHPEGTNPTGTDVEAPPFVAMASDRIEMRRGSVRLVLLRQGEGADDPISGDQR